jgi:hypothetical protein
MATSSIRFNIVKFISLTPAPIPAQKSKFELIVILYMLNNVTTLIGYLRTAYQVVEMVEIQSDLGHLSTH